MNLPWYALEIESHFTAFSVRINDVVLSTDRNLPARDERIAVNQWVFTGGNTLAVSLWVLPTWKELPAEMDFLARVCRYSPGSIEPEVLAEFRWGKEEDSGEIAFPIVQEVAFTVTAGFTPWSWSGADTLAGDFRTEPSLIAFLNIVHATMHTRDLDGIVALCTPKALEMAEAFGIPTAERLREQREFFSGLFSNPSFAMKPLDKDGMVTQVHAQGRLLEVTDRAGEPVISTLALQGDAAFGLEMFVCRMEGLWRICR